MKREDYISRDEYFMWIAVLSAHRSKDPSTQVWACIINEDNRIVWIWYNGFPRWISDDTFPWEKNNSMIENKLTYVVHAEANAILNSIKNLDNCILYTTLFPCNECSKLILQSGITHIKYLYHRPQKEYEIASRKMLEAAGIKITQLDLKDKNIILNFDESL